MLISLLNSHINYILCVRVCMCVWGQEKKAMAYRLVAACWKRPITQLENDANKVAVCLIAQPHAAPCVNLLLQPSRRQVRVVRHTSQRPHTPAFAQCFPIQQTHEKCRHHHLHHPAATAAVLAFHINRVFVFAFPARTKIALIPFAVIFDS